MIFGINQVVVLIDKYSFFGQVLFFFKEYILSGVVEVFFGLMIYCFVFFILF